MSFKILYKDDTIIAIEKPAGFYVHPPEDKRFKISNQTNCLHILNKQLNSYLYPVHRIDRPTSGVLVFALNPIAARILCEQFRQQSLQKVYYCVVRGWPPDHGCIDYSLRSEDSKKMEVIPAVTYFENIAKTELPFANSRFNTSRYSILKVFPKTGRKHQIRRHLTHLSYPLVGDTIYGDTRHNYFYREVLNINGLLLKSYSIEFTHPENEKLITISAHWNHLWHQVFNLFGICPFDTKLFSHRLGST